MERKFIKIGNNTIINIEEVACVYTWESYDICFMLKRDSMYSVTFNSERERNEEFERIHRILGG